jgi:hypothetical protein
MYSCVAAWRDTVVNTMPSTLQVFLDTRKLMAKFKNYWPSFITLDSGSKTGGLSVKIRGQHNRQTYTVLLCYGVGFVPD